MPDIIGYNANIAQYQFATPGLKLSTARALNIPRSLLTISSAFTEVLLLFGMSDTISEIDTL